MPGIELNTVKANSYIDRGLAQRVQRFRDEGNPAPTLEIITDNYNDKSPTGRYINLKHKVGNRLGFVVGVNMCTSEASILNRVETYSADRRINGIVVQLPTKAADIDSILNSVAPEKDVDGLGTDALHEPATALAVLRLMKSFKIDYLSQKVAILGQGRLVGAPLARMLEQADHGDVKTFDDRSDAFDIMRGINDADVVISAMGHPGAIEPGLFADLERPRVLIDAGTTEQDGVIHGDVSHSMREAALEYGWQVTPALGGLGPMTVRMLLDNSLAAAQLQRSSVPTAA